MRSKHKALLATALLAAALFSGDAQAGGYGGGCCGKSFASASDYVGLSDHRKVGRLEVTHDEEAGASASVGGKVSYGKGFGNSTSTIDAGGLKVSVWSRSVQRARGTTDNKTASGSGFSATFFKVLAEDGSYYMGKGYANANAWAGPAGASAGASGFFASKAGRL
jgi:hypothetical protein